MTTTPSPDYIIPPKCLHCPGDYREGNNCLLFGVTIWQAHRRIGCGGGVVSPPSKFGQRGNYSGRGPRDLDPERKLIL